MPLLVGNDIPKMSLNVSFDLVKSVGEKYRQSRKGFICWREIQTIKKRVCCTNISSDISKFRSASQYETDQISLRRKLCCFLEIAVHFLLFFFLYFVLASVHEMCKIMPKNPYKLSYFRQQE